VAGPYLLGVDGGTEGLRAGVFDLEGAPLGFASTPYRTDFPNPGWAEQDPRDWWRALGRSVRQVVAEAKVAPADIAAIALDTTCCSVVALDRQGEPIRPALIWMDMRSGSVTGRVAGCGDPALKVNSAGAGPVSAEWMVPKALWLKENEPATFDAAAHICEFQDYLNFHLTGRMVASINNASVRWHYGARDGGYQPGLLGRLGLEALLEKWPGDVLPLGDTIGGLTPAAAGHLGLPAGLPVAQGGADAFIGMIGLGVVRPGRLAFITGSSHLHLGLSDAEFHGKGVWGTYADAVIPGLHVVEGGQTSTGSVVNWFKGMLGEDVTYDSLNAEAAMLPPGAEGLIVLDHFQGNRTPYTDPNSRGVISGLTLRHGPAHIFRAIIEGISFGTELILETMRSTGFEPRDVVIAGGATRSDLWLQTHADVSGLPLSLTKVADAPALGSAILAAVGAGLYDDIPTASDNMVQVVRQIEPDPARHEAYRPFYEAYKDTYPALAELLHRQAGA
jgi:FGGY-family pentulose kinase